MDAVVAADKLIVTAPVIKLTETLVIVVPGAIPEPVTYIPTEYILEPDALFAIKIEVAPLVTAVAPTVPEKVPEAPWVFKLNRPIEVAVIGSL